MTARSTGTPRLTVDLAPFGMWGKNVRAVVAMDTWEELRWHLGATWFRPRFSNIGLPPPKNWEKLVCTICLTEQKSLELHEEWEYDDIKRIQRLVALIPICSLCHLAKHLGYANVIGRADEALAQLAKINRWSLKQAERYKARAFAKWLKRSPFQYTLDLKRLEKYIPKSKIHLDWLDDPRGWISSRLDSIVWAHSLLESEALILDIETTGLLKENPKAEAIELSIINMKGKVLYNQLFRPIYSIPRKVVRVHGIRNGDVKSAPSFANELKTVRKILTGKKLSPTTRNSIVPYSKTLVPYTNENGCSVAGNAQCTHTERFQDREDI